jgi:sugar O-acyltransferase (sialic acid O-acetyltransferase NeuD family)
MFKEKIVVIGAGGHAQSCIDVIEAQGKYKIAGLIGKESEIGREVLGYPVLGCDKDLPYLSPEINNAVIGIGQIESSQIRKGLFLEVKEYGFKLPVIISPNAHISRSAYIGSGTIVMHHALVNPGVKIGENCIINSKVIIEHNSVIENHSHISTGAIVNGDCLIESGTFIGSGSVIREGSNIGMDSIIGMNVAVRKDIPAKSRYTGEKHNES